MCCSSYERQHGTLGSTPRQAFSSYTLIGFFSARSIFVVPTLASE
jgi:hypothetical protein